jgi:hypothetical protein
MSQTIDSNALGGASQYSTFLLKRHRCKANEAANISPVSDVTYGAFINLALPNDTRTVVLTAIFVTFISPR